MREAPSQHFSFRLSAQDARELCRHASDAGLSPGQLARLLVMQALSNAQLEAVAEQLDALRQKVSELSDAQERLAEGQARLDAQLAHSVEALLVDAGRVDPAKAAKWVRNQFRSP